METSQNTKTTRKIDLIDGEFTASEALDVIDSVLNVKINFHKLNRLSITEGNQEDDCNYDSGRIANLINERQSAKEFFTQEQMQGKKIKMRSVIQIEIED